MLLRTTAFCAFLLASAAAFAPSNNVHSFSTKLNMRSEDSASSPSTDDRRSFVTKTGSTVAAAALASATGTLGVPTQPAEAASSQMWKPVALPFAETLYDIDFDTPDHGYLVGARGSFAETNDGGETWEPRSFSNLDAEEEVTYRFTVSSFTDGEGWVLGKPTLMLHTKDAGKTWERIPLSPKLPGEPTSITSLGPGKAEMTTSVGAVYVTENAGRNWKAQVKETIDATLNRISSSGVSGASYFTGSIISQIRDDDGAYWLGTPRRIQNMGFVEGDINKGVWMTLNGGKLLICDSEPDLKADTFDFKEANIKTGGFGITDVAWRNKKEVWAVGGSNTMYVSTDGGKNFSFDKSANNIPGNLYNVKFFKEFGNKGFALGSNGLLLKYVG
eukprot:jgi/Psemu1/314068/fgenesh1_kg.1404_\